MVFSVYGEAMIEFFDGATNPDEALDQIETAMKDAFKECRGHALVKAVKMILKVVGYWRDDGEQTIPTELYQDMKIARTIAETVQVCSATLPCHLAVVY